MVSLKTDQSLHGVLPVLHTPFASDGAIDRAVEPGPTRQQLTHLKVYAGAEQPHEAQQPEVLDLKTKNAKNTRSAA